MANDSGGTPGAGDDHDGRSQWPTGAPPPAGTDDSLARRLRVEQDERRRQEHEAAAAREATSRRGRRRRTKTQESPFLFDGPSSTSRSDAHHDGAPRSRSRAWGVLGRVVGSRRFGQLVALALVCGVLTVWATKVQERNRREADRMVAAGIFLDPTMSRGVDLTGFRPPPGFEESPQPLGQPPTTTAPGPHTFAVHQSDGRTPVAYDPCRPVHYLVNPAGATADGDQLIAAAVARVATATGLTFVYDGHTDEVWAQDRPAFQPERYPDRWAPVLISWSTPDAVPELAGAVAGIGGSAQVELSGGSVYVTGAIVLDGPQLAELATELSPVFVEATIQHELGHVVGLGHVDDETQLMNPVGNEGVTDYAPGDLEGLAALGRGRCFPGV